MTEITYRFEVDTEKHAAKEQRLWEMLRAKRPTLAIGFAFAGQETGDVPLEATDQALDLIVTEVGVIEITQI